MVTNKLFEGNYRIAIEKKIKNLLNSAFDVSKIEQLWMLGDFLGENFNEIQGGLNLNLTYSLKFARRAMADLAFYDAKDFYYVVDVKTHRLDTDFNMPNLTSVERLTRFYEDDKNYFVVLELAYEVKGVRVEVEHVHFIPIEFLNWNCLTIGALGWGQLQIANSNRINILPQNSRKKWMLQFCDRMLEFYPAEIGKINERIEYFKRVKKHWRQRV